MSNVLVIYHANCLDGLAAATAAYETFQRDKTNCCFLAANYSDRDYIMSILTGNDHDYKSVYFLDFSLKRADMEEIERHVDHITVLDHHKTAKEELEGMYDIELTKSGAVLSYQFFNPGVQVPKKYLLVQDRDLWKWEFPETRYYTLSLFNGRGKSLENFMEQFELPIEEHVRNGEKINQYCQNRMDEIILDSVCYTEVDGYKGIPVINCPSFFSSDIGNRLSINNPFVVLWNRKQDRYEFSLRSNTTYNPKGIDVSKIAKRFGGGGHGNAAGFSANCDDVESIELFLKSTKLSFWEIIKKKIRYLFR